MQHTISRRRFVRTSLIAAAGVSFSGYRCLASKSSIPQHIGLQLYSVRDNITQNPVSVLAAVAKMGYREVEAYGFEKGNLFGLSYADFGKALADNNLTMPSTHCAVTLADYDPQNNQISDALKKCVDTAAAMGLQYVICPWMRIEDRPLIAQMLPVYQAMARYCQQAGVRFAYHNHNFEFEQRGPDNRLLIEWILQETDPALTAMEMDIYWVTYAGHNPLDWIRLYPGRWELCHAKDMAQTEGRPTVEIGEGVIDFKTIFEQRKAAGFQYFIVELEHYRTTPLQGVELAREGLLTMF